MQARCLRCDCFLRRGNTGQYCAPCRRGHGLESRLTGMKAHYEMMRALEAERIRLADTSPWYEEDEKFRRT